MNDLFFFLNKDSHYAVLACLGIQYVDPDTLTLNTSLSASALSAGIEGMGHQIHLKKFNFKGSPIRQNTVQYKDEHLMFKKKDLIAWK